MNVTRVPGQDAVDKSEWLSTRVKRIVTVTLRLKCGGAVPEKIRQPSMLPRLATGRVAVTNGYQQNSMMILPYSESDI